MAKKTFNEKLNDSKNMPHVEVIDDVRVISRFGGNRMLIAPPLYYDEIIKKIPCGMLLTSDIVRNHLAKRHAADFTCPLTAGIFINISAHAAVERGTDDTPYWRLLKKDGELNEKYPLGIDGQKMLLEMEGHRIIQKGKRYFVEEYQTKLFSINK